MQFTGSIFYEFVADSGEKLNWWPATGTITIIGHPGEVKKLSQQLNEFLAATADSEAAWYA